MLIVVRLGMIVDLFILIVGMCIVKVVVVTAVLVIVVTEGLVDHLPQRIIVIDGECVVGE